MYTRGGEGEGREERKREKREREASTMVSSNNKDFLELISHFKKQLLVFGLSRISYIAQHSQISCSP